MDKPLTEQPEPRPLSPDSVPGAHVTFGYISGETIEVVIDLGFYISVQTIVRLAGIDAPEIDTEAGSKVKVKIEELLAGGKVVLSTIKKEKYGRYLAVVMCGEINVNEQMVESGHAKPYDGGKR